MGAVVVVAAMVGGDAGAIEAQTRRRSPRETVQASVGDATISITYGRPYARGRAIMGELVPYGQIWRTGADEATRFVTDRNLQMGRTIVPAGSYSLYTVPGPDEWTLILNTQTGQWGTVYNEDRDLARVPMRREEIEPVEQLTIAVEPAAAEPSASTSGESAGADGVLALEWETTRVSVPFRVR